MLLSNAAIYKYSNILAKLTRYKIKYIVEKVNTNFEKYF